MRLRVGQLRKGKRGSTPYNGAQLVGALESSLAPAMVKDDRGAATQLQVQSRRKRRSRLKGGKSMLLAILLAIFIITSLYLLFHLRE